MGDITVLITNQRLLIALTVVGVMPNGLRRETEGFVKGENDNGCLLPTAEKLLGTRLNYPRNFLPFLYSLYFAPILSSSLSLSWSHDFILFSSIPSSLLSFLLCWTELMTRKRDFFSATAVII